MGGFTMLVDFSKNELAGLYILVCSEGDKLQTLYKKVRAAKIAPQGLGNQIAENKAMQEKLIKAVHSFNQLETPAPKCAACSGKLKAITQISGTGVMLFKCSDCSGLQINDPIDTAKALEIVNFREFETVKVTRQTYFDFMVKYPDNEIRRVHGWFNPETRKVTQIG